MFNCINASVWLRDVGATTTDERRLEAFHVLPTTNPCIYDGTTSLPTPQGYGMLVVALWCASGCVVECRICNREVAGSNLGLGYFAPRSTQPSIPPRSVNEYQLRLGRQRQVVHSDCGWTCGCAGKTVKSLENTCHTWALLRW